MLGIERADRVHQFLDSDCRMIAMADVEQVRNDVRGTSLQTIYVDARVAKEFLPGLRHITEERQLIIIAPRQGFSRIEPCPTDGRVEVEA
ncbi:hypothetical protein [Rhizobium sullae]|uniref:hypothetical protein n=1 Tax=Rhizobium sullae TaxID=50338 RepID=UPI0012EBB147|nr:hypothetical protein [Rhizobium sullae]